MSTTSIQNHASFLQYISIIPIEEGIARVQRCVYGVDFTQIELPPRSLADRVIDLLTGLALCVPIISAIIWICMKQFGRAETLSVKSVEIEPWAEAAEAARKLPYLNVPTLEVVAATEPARIEEYTTVDKVHNKPAVETQVKIAYYSEAIVVRNSSPVKASEYVYDLTWSLQQMHYKDENKQLDITLIREGNEVRLTGLHQGNALDKTFHLCNSNIPWIQEMSQGIRPFALSTSSITDCYGIDPTGEPSLTLGKLTKEIKNDSHYGQVAEVKLKAATGYKSWFGTVRTSFHDIKTGKQYKEKWEVPLIYSSESILKSTMNEGE